MTIDNRYLSESSVRICTNIGLLFTSNPATNTQPVTYVMILRSTIGSEQSAMQPALALAHSLCYRYWSFSCFYDIGVVVLSWREEVTVLLHAVCCKGCHILIIILNLFRVRTYKHKPCLAKLRLNIHIS